jgi:flagellar secretion chaperone FliS
MHTRRPMAYQDMEVMTSSKERLVPLLYEHLLKRLRMAGKQIEEGDIEGRSENLQKASSIVFELLGSLDFDAGGELASRLAGLYGFFAGEIADVGRTRDTQRLDALIQMIAGLHTAWDQAARQVAGGRSDA